MSTPPAENNNNSAPIIVASSDGEDAPAPRQQQRDAKYSLHDLILGKEAYRYVERRVAEHPHQACEKVVANLFRDKTVCYPLHVACRLPHVPARTIEALIGAAPQAVTSRDSLSQSYPLHIACWYDLDLTIIQTLIANMPRDKQHMLDGDVDGNTPLHLCAMYATNPATILAVLEQSPSSNIVKLVNKRGQTPLHCACLRRDMVPMVLQAMLKQAPEAAKVVDWQGRLPLHIACQNQANSKILQILLEAHPEGCLRWDKQYLTPYGIFRTRFQISTKDERCRLLRRYMQRVSSTSIKLRNVVQFRIEDLRATKPFGGRRQVAAVQA